MTASFDTVSFGERGDGGDHFPIAGSKAVTTQHRPPGGNVLVVQSTGDRVQLLGTTAETDYAGYLALVDKLGTTGALSLGTTSGSAQLAEVAGQDIAASGVFFCDLVFLINSSTFGRTGFGTSPFGSDFG